MTSTSGGERRRVRSAGQSGEPTQHVRFDGVLNAWDKEHDEHDGDHKAHDKQDAFQRQAPPELGFRGPNSNSQVVPASMSAGVT